MSDTARKDTGYLVSIISREDTTIATRKAFRHLAGTTKEDMKGYLI